ncbi:putative gp38 [Burkholderia pseudomallei MSHR2990]|nr:putative gp38 [Burkholderia pseudomallei MSHR2990]
MTEMLNSLKEVIARAAASPAAEAVAWVRKHPDTGELSGDWLWNDAIEQCRKDSGVWFPLGFLGARPALPEEPAAIHQVIHQVWVEETSSWADVTPAYYAERQPSNRRRVYYAPQPAQADAPAHATECPHCDGEGVIEADSGASPCACAQDAQEGMPTFGARRTQADAPAEAREPNQIYVEVRQCDRCDHIGINDGHATDAACGYPCGWSGPSPVEDKCPGCGHENVMSVACPKCSGHYSLLANGLFETNEVSEPAEAREPIAWVTDDDRAITAAQKQRALADGGATASSVRPYSIPCYAVSAAADAGEAVGSVTISKPGDSATGISFMSLNEHGRQTLGKGKHLLYTNAKSSTLTVGRQQTIGRAADTLEFHGLKTEATELRALLDSTQQEAKECACPNGDGSLRQPCPVHPPTQTSADLADDDKRDAERYRTHVKYEYETIYMPAVEKKGLRPLAFAEYKASADQVADAARTQESKS